MEQDSLRKKYEQVSTWIDEIFSERDVPQYEISDSTVDYLVTLQRKNLKMNSIILSAIDNIIFKRNEYREEAERLKTILEGIGLPVQSFSIAGKTALKTLSDLAIVLDIKNVKRSSYCVAMLDLQSAFNDTIQQLTEKRSDIETLMAATTASLKQMTNMKQCHNKMEETCSVDEPVMEKRQKDIVILRDKYHGYEAHIEESKNNLWRNINQDLYHEKLIHLSEDLAELKKELQPLAKKFQSYRSLPPDLDLAKVKIEEEKRELRKLEKELQADIELLAL